MLFFAHRQHSREAFEREVLPHLGTMYAVALSLARNERDAEDLVQDAVLRGWRFFSTFQPGSNAKAWVLRILRNVFVSRYRRRVREHEAARVLHLHEDLSTMSQAAADAAIDPERVILDGILSEQVVRALDALPEDFRLAVVLCDLEGLPYKDIADVMECPIGTVMSRLHRGRRALQQELRGYAAERGIGLDPDEPAMAGVIALRSGSRR